MFGFIPEADAATKASDKDSISSDFKTKKYFRENKLSGLYQEFDPFTDQIKEEGYFQNGIETGKWRVIDQDGDQIHYMYQMVRIGARCRDGSISQATGRGACSWHGGVSEWMMGSQQTQIGGTGKYLPPEQRVEALKSKVKAELGINKTGLQLEQQILKLSLNFIEQIKALKKQLEVTKQQLKEKTQNEIQLQKQAKTQQKQKPVSDDLKPSKDIGDDKKTQHKFCRSKELLNPQPQKPSSYKNRSPVLEKSQNIQAAKQKQPTKNEEELTKQKLRNAFQKYKLKQPEKDDDDSSDSESDNEQRSQNQSELIRQLMQKMNVSGDSK